MGKGHRGRYDFRLGGRLCEDACSQDTPERRQCLNLAQSAPYCSCSKRCFSVILATTPNKQLSYLFLKQNICGAPPPGPGATCIPRLRGEPLPPNPEAREAGHSRI